MTDLRARWVSAAALVALSAAPLTARATPEPSDEVASRVAFDRGVVLADSGHMTAACPLFEKAHALHATGGTALRLGACFEATDRLQKAYELYLFILNNKANEKYPERVRFARAHATALSKRLTTMLPPPDTSAAEPAPETPARPAQDASPSRLPAVIAFSVGGAGLVVGGVFGGLALSQASSVKTSCTDGVCPAAQQSASDAAKTKGWASTVGFGVGGVGVVVGIVLLATRGSAAPAAATTAATRFEPRADGFVVRF